MLPVTGGSPLGVVAVGVLAIVTGVLLVKFGRRRAAAVGVIVLIGGFAIASGQETSAASGCPTTTTVAVPSSSTTTDPATTSTFLVSTTTTEGPTTTTVDVFVACATGTNTDGQEFLFELENGFGTATIFPEGSGCTGPSFGQFPVGNSNVVDPAEYCATNFPGRLPASAEGAGTWTPPIPDGLFACIPPDPEPTTTTTEPTTTTAVNDAPTATDDSFSTDEDSPLTVAAPGVLGNDTDPDGDTLSATLVSSPSNGTLTLNIDGSFTYTPTSNFGGSDSFTYQANDGTSSSNVAVVTITVTAVNDAPSAADDSYSTPEDTELNVAAPGVLGNDADVDGDVLSAFVVTGPSNGFLFNLPDGTFDYVPLPGFNGTDSFTYQASDGALSSNVATVTIIVTE